MGLKNIAAATLCVCLAACGAPETRQPPPKGTGVELAHPPTQANVYAIDSAQSELRVLVYRAGPMARLGHNHIMLNRAITGWVDAGAGPESASFSLSVPVADFVVDDARARSDEGSDFAAQVTEDARSGTRRNMLSGALLDAEHVPVMTLTSTGIARRRDGGLSATLTVSLGGHQSMITVPFALETSTGRIATSGSVPLRQSDLGLTPISVMLGALQVQDELTVKFRFVATAGHT